MPDKNSGYIVFRADIKRTDEMIFYASEWFVLVDRSPAIYGIYSESIVSDRGFTEDLFFCIRLYIINDTDGVIMFRPTASPVVYKQQVGLEIQVRTKKIPSFLTL